MGDNDRAPPSDVPEAPSGTAERRQATVLFADLVGFTAFSERQGEEVAYSLMEYISELMTDAIHGQSGTVKSFTGDGVMALFGVPAALEDAPLRACRAALDIQQRIESQAVAIKAKYGLRPQMRIGINTGPMIVGQVRSGESTSVTAIGDTVNLAARLQSLAQPGAVVLSEATHRLVEGLIVSVSAGEHDIKGKTERQRIFQLETIRQGAARFDRSVSRGLTACVGRSRELEILEQGLHDAARGTRVIDLAGDPGIGKSRLIHEFRRHLAQQQVFVLSGQCRPDGQQTPFLPFIDVVRGSFRVSEGEAEAEISRKLEKGLLVLGLASEENLGLLLNLLGLKPPEGTLKGLDGVLIGLRTRDLLMGLLRERCRIMPVVMVIEDIHWIDSVSEELLGRVLAVDEALPLLIIQTRRTEYRPPWAAHHTVAVLKLDPLSSRETTQIILARLGMTELPPSFVRLVAERAEGNPLFAEEIASYLVERGLVRSTPTGLEYDAATIASALPASIQGLLTARMDRLPHGDRALLQAASVIGRRFSPGLLTVVADAAIDIANRLSAMQALDLIYEDRNSGDFLFKHALVRDVAYDGLVSTARTALHLKVAAEIERRGNNRLDEVAEHLAYHYDRAGATTKAFRYNVMAGRKSLGLYSLDDAERYFSKALALLDSHSDAATDLALAEVVERYAYLLNLNTRVKELCVLVETYLPRLESLEPSAHVVMTLHHYSFALATGAKYKQAKDISEQAMLLASRLDDNRSRAYARASAFFISTIFAPMSIEAIDREGRLAISEAQTDPDGYIETWVQFTLAWDHHHRGELPRARALAGKVIADARQRNNPRALGLGLWTLGWIDIVDERYDAALEHAEEGISASILALDRDVNFQVKGISLVLLGQVVSGSALLSDLRTQFVTNGWLYNLCGTDLIVSIGRVLAGQFGRGIRDMKNFIAGQDRAGYGAAADWGRVYLAEVYLELLSGNTKPPITVMLRNAVFLVCTLPFAAGRARDLLLRASANVQFSRSGALSARIEYDLGWLHKIKKRPALARSHLDRARTIAEQLKASTLLAKIDAMLASLA